jgi:hypothetical protein
MGYYTEVLRQMVVDIMSNTKIQMINQSVSVKVKVMVMMPVSYLPVGRQVKRLCNSVYL